MNNQVLRSCDVDGGASGVAPRWLLALGFIAMCVMLSGSACPKHLMLNEGAGKSASTAVAGTSLWSTNGPYGGQIRSIAIDPISSQTVYVGGYGGVFKSIDGGRNWAAANVAILYPSYILRPDILLSMQ